MRNVLVFKVIIDEGVQEVVQAKNCEIYRYSHEQVLFLSTLPHSSHLESLLRLFVEGRVQRVSVIHYLLAGYYS